MSTPNLNERTTKEGTFNILKKWITLVDYVDIETGELVTRKEFKNNYLKFNSTKTIIQNEKYNIRKYLITGRRGTQLKLF